MSWRDLFRRSKRPSPTSTSALGMAMLRGGDFRAGPAFTHLMENWSDLPSIADVMTDGPTTTAVIPGGAIGMVHIPAPIPSGDLEGPIKLAWQWPDAARVVPSHQTHVLVHVASTALSPVTCRLLLTRMLASILATGDGLGVYAGDALLVWPANEYIAQARVAAPDALPIPLWIGLHPVDDPPGLSAYTTGLSSFGLMELEVRHSALPPSELLGRLADLANYQLASGNVLRDGDTFGETEFDRTRVRHVYSDFIPETQVVLLEL